MAIGNKNKNSNKLFILKLKTRDADKKDVHPFFEILEKKDEKSKWTKTQESTNISGDLVNVVLEKGDHEGQEYDIVKLTFRDNAAHEDYLLDLRVNMLTRNLFNSLVNLNSFEDLSISLYETSKGEKTYPAVALRQNDTLVKWRFSLEDLPKPKKVVVGKKTLTDFTELDEFFLNELSELATKIKGTKPAPKKDISKPVDDADIPEENFSDESGDDTDIPF